MTEFEAGERDVDFDERAVTVSRLLRNHLLEDGVERWREIRGQGSPGNVRE
ncbi:hypothetical protein [Anatilimnocola floriformis]|uniref:hypothetical protein n=1 Tax=Anatilimnocola floriformis TaxID=2948575 RepID=UPI0020C4D171|nr:hypothetical protein [Anatilimnocola floriformis]